MEEEVASLEQVRELERLDAVFRLSPYGGPRIKAVKKEQKLYCWDWARCASEGARFENMLALHLLRAVHWAVDVEGEKLQLRYFRHRAGLEVDFVVLRGRRPWLAVEATLSESELAPGLRYFVERTQPNFVFQVVLRGVRDRTRVRRLRHLPIGRAGAGAGARVHPRVLRAIAHNRGDVEAAPQDPIVSRARPAEVSERAAGAGPP